MIKKYISILAVIAILAGGVFAIDYFSEGGPGDSSNINPLDDSNSTPEKVSSVIQANNKFALDLLSKYEEKYREKNIFFSPYSIWSALGMTYEGAKGKTAEQMEEVFYYPKEDVRRPGFAELYNKLNKEKSKYKLHTANALWAQKDHTFLESFFSIIENFYGGKVRNLNFAKEPEKSRKTINSWVEDKTEDKIKDLLPKGSVGPSTRLVLTNAIYFYGDWATQFDKDNTRKQDFKINSQNTVKADMMHMDSDTSEEAGINYADLDNLKILEIPYKGEELSMMILLPKKDKTDIGGIVSLLNTEKLNEWRGALSETGVEIAIPKFKFKKKYQMKRDLSQMGMPLAFSSSANFSGMTGRKDLYIDQVYHQAFVEVDEEGTEAAGATGVVVPTSSGPRDLKKFIADHPFIFLIQENKTGEILFLGKVKNPAK